MTFSGKTWAVGEALGAEHRTDHNRLKTAFDNRGLDVTEYGAVGDGSTLDDSAIAAAIADLEDGMGLVFPYDKVFKVSASMVLSGLRYVHLSGRGARFLWAGDTSTPMFNIKGCRDSTFEGFDIKSSAATPLAEGFRVETLSGSTSSNLKFYEIEMEGGSSGGLDYGWRAVEGTGGDSNNDLFAFYRCHVRNYDEAAWSFEHSQSHDHVLDKCQWSGGGGAKYGVTTALGSGAGGFFEARNCGGGGTTVADYYLGSPSGRINIFGGNFEGSAALLTTGVSSNAYPITIVGVRWAVTASIAANKRIVDYGERGPLVMVGNTFDGTLDSAVLYNGSNSDDTRCTAIGNSVRTSVVDPFDGRPWIKFGNVIDDESTRSHLEPSITGATDTDKITSIIAALESLGLATDATT